MHVDDNNNSRRYVCLRLHIVESNNMKCFRKKIKIEETAWDYIGTAAACTGHDRGGAATCSGHYSGLSRAKQGSSSSCLHRA